MMMPGAARNRNTSRPEGSDLASSQNLSGRINGSLQHLETHVERAALEATYASVMQLLQCLAACVERPGVLHEELAKVARCRALQGAKPGTWLQHSARRCERTH